MNANPDYHRLSVKSMNRVNDACDAFEASLTSDSQQSISERLIEFLNGLSDCLTDDLTAVRRALFQHLVEAACLLCGADRPELLERDYWHCFLPEFEDVLDRINWSTRDSAGNEIEAMTSSSVDVDRFGPYRILKQVGEGGMGIVFLADQLTPIKRHVALKVIRSDVPSNQILARFEAERQALTMMNHPNIARVLDVGTSERGRPYFAMEYVRGVAITEYCDSNKVDLNGRLLLVIQTCLAVHHAHQKGIIHRDLKPSNIMVTSHGNKPTVKVIDFGLAKAIRQGIELTPRTLMTQHGQMLGTLPYMSPEQALMNECDVDTRTDVYSLGVVLYELLTGSTPIHRSNLQTAGLDLLLRSLREVETPRPSTRLIESEEDLVQISSNRKLSPDELTIALKGDLDWIAIKSLEKDRSERYDGAASLADDLNRYLQGDPVVAHPPSSVYRLLKLFKKHKVSFSAGVVFFTMIAFSLIATTELWRRASIAERRARQAEDSMRGARDEAVTATQVSQEQLRKARAQLYSNYLSEAILAGREGNSDAKEVAFQKVQDLGIEPGWEYRMAVALASADTWRSQEVWQQETAQHPAMKGPWQFAILPEQNLMAVPHHDGTLELRKLESGTIVKSAVISQNGSPFSPMPNSIASVVQVPGSHGKRLYASDVSGVFYEISVPDLRIVEEQKVSDGGISRLIATKSGVVIAMLSVWVNDVPQIAVKFPNEKQFRSPLEFLTDPLEFVTLNSADQVLAVSKSGQIARLSIDPDSDFGFGPAESWDSGLSGLQRITGLGGEQVAVAGVRNEVAVFDLRQGKITRRISTKTADIKAIAYDEGTGFLAVGGNSHYLTVVDLETNKTRLVMQQGRGRYYGVSDIAFCQMKDTQVRMVSCGPHIRFDDLLDLKPESVISDFPGAAEDVSVSRDNRSLAIAFNDTLNVDAAGIQIRDLETGEITYQDIGFGHPRFVKMSDEGKKCVVQFSHKESEGVWTNGILLIQKASSWSSRIIGHQETVMEAAAFSEDSSLLATLGRGGELSIWNTETGIRKCNLTIEDSGRGHSVEFIGNDKVVACYGTTERYGPGRLRLWNIESQQEVASAPMNGRYLSVNGEEMRVVSKDRISEWLVGPQSFTETRQQPVPSFFSNSENLAKAAGWRFIGEYLVFALNQRDELLVWDPQNQTELLRVPTSHGALRAVDVIANETIVTSGADGKVKLWTPAAEGSVR